jgi:hypothetical protein
MAHFAKINSDNIVEQIVVVNNSDCAGGQYPQSEASGAEFCSNLFGGQWKQTSYNQTFRKHFAGIGFTYDPVRDAFIAPRPFPSWSLNEDTCEWVAPSARPDGNYSWDEATLEWVPVNKE